MHDVSSREVLQCLDMIMLDTGEILSLCGTYSGEWCRARLTFRHDIASARLIAGRPYTKLRYETGCQIRRCRKILDLPGEQHFLVHRSRIAKVYKATAAFDGLTSEKREQCQSFIDLLASACGLSREQHGLTGSGALHSMESTSDFDWVIYARDHANVEACMTTDSRCAREMTFPMSHVYKKYGVFTGLRRADIDALFRDRWKYLRFRDLSISLNFVDPRMRADGFLRSPQFDERVVVTGTITDDVGCYHMPRCIPFRSEGNEYSVLTWLFLYNGAFRNGDVVEISGIQCQLEGRQYLHVESPSDYIRKVNAERRNSDNGRRSGCTGATCDKKRYLADCCFLNGSGD